jgi:hypothetical protein
VKKSYRVKYQYSYAGSVKRVESFNDFGEALCLFLCMVEDGVDVSLKCIQEVN